jgi:hypothetical protein
VPIGKIFLDFLKTFWHSHLTFHLSCM